MVSSNNNDNSSNRTLLKETVDNDEETVVIDLEEESGFLLEKTNKSHEKNKSLAESVDDDLSYSTTKVGVSLYDNLIGIVLALFLMLIVLSLVNYLILPVTDFLSYLIILPYSPRWIRVVSIATVLLLSSAYMLFVRKIPAGIVLFVGGMHALLMKWNYDYASTLGWTETALAFLVITMYDNDSTTKAATITTTRSPLHLQEVAVWALYAALICLGLPTLHFLGDNHQPSALAQLLILIVPLMLDHSWMELILGVLVILQQSFLFINHNNEFMSTNHHLQCFYSLWFGIVIGKRWRELTAATETIERTHRGKRNNMT